jgi:hypothetical protein
VILLERSNEWNLSPAKEGSLKKKRKKREKEAREREYYNSIIRERKEKKRKNLSPTNKYSELQLD